MRVVHGLPHSLYFQNNEVQIFKLMMFNSLKPQTNGGVLYLPVSALVLVSDVSRYKLTVVTYVLFKVKQDTG